MLNRIRTLLPHWLPIITCHTACPLLTWLAIFKFFMGDQTEISEKLTFYQVTRNNNYFDLKLLVCKHHKMLDVIFVAKV